MEINYFLIKIKEIFFNRFKELILMLYIFRENLNIFILNFIVLFAIKQYYIIK